MKMFGKANILSYHPIRARVRVEWKDGRAVLVYPKNLTRFERWLHKIIGGPLEIRRPLDDVGTYIWRLCDGKHSVEDICNKVWERFKEDVEPVKPRVTRFILILRNLNLVFFAEEIKKDA